MANQNWNIIYDDEGTEQSYNVVIKSASATSFTNALETLLASTPVTWASIRYMSRIIEAPYVMNADGTVDSAP